MTDDRTEHDSLGDVRVPSGVLWGPQTQRATENFPISGSEVDPALIRALALVKAAAARVNGELGALDADRSAAVERAALQVAAGEHTDQFPVDVFQTGSGTSTNMNLNEVIAKLASTPDLPIHPNDHVNAGQSSNDTFPTAIHVAAARTVREELIPGLHTLQAGLAAKSAEFADLVKAGRTHLMDATPVTLGQEFSGYAATVSLALERLDGVLPRVCELPLGGTAVGTGLTASPAFAAQVIGLLTEVTGVPFTETRNHFEGQGTRDSLVELSGVLRTIAVGLTKIANDLRWMASGPLTGLAEIRLPALQPGSSIMPGKVNPVLPEAALMVCAQVVGNDATIAWAGASGSFELNTMLPVLGQNLLESIRLLARVTPLLATRCIDGITADAARLRRFAEASPAIATALARRLGYDRTAEVVAHAQQASLTIKEAVIALGFVADGTLAESELDALLDVDAMTRRAPDGSAG